MTHKFILGLEAAAFAFTAWRLFARGLARRQTSLLAFLLFRSVTMVATLFLPARSAVYFWSYMVFAPLDSLFSVVAVRETIGLVLDDYPGLRTVGRWTMYGAVAASLVSAVLIGAAFWRTNVTSHLYYVQVSTRSVMFGLAVTLISLLLFLSHYPISLTRNRMVSSVAFGSLFLSEAIALFVDSLAETFRVPAVDLASIAFGAVCLVVWGALLQPQEADRPARPGGPDDEDRSVKDERLLRQLRAMEQMARKLGQSRA